MEPDRHADAPKKRGRKPSGLPYCKLCNRHLHKCPHGRREKDNDREQGTATRSQSSVEVLKLQKKRKVQEGKLGHAMREVKKLRHPIQSDKRREVLDKVKAANEAIKQVCFEHIRLYNASSVDSKAQAWLANSCLLFCFFLLLFASMQVEQDASTSRKKKEKGQIHLDIESTTSALKKLHKLKMKDLKLKHITERNRLKSALAMWENGVSKESHMLDYGCCFVDEGSYLRGEKKA
jgi:hypothetical protein